MKTVAVICIMTLTACAGAKAVARTALDVAREACELFAAEAPPDALGMSLDECADHLLSAHKLAAAKREMP